MLSIALGVRQAKLDAEMRAFFQDARPWAFILFREACVSRVQVRALCDELRDAAGHDAIVWIDQEGGRVARLKPPEWPTWPAAAKYGEAFARDNVTGIEATYLGHRLIAHELKSMGVDGDYAPVLDVPIDGSDKIVGDRAFSAEPKLVATLARAALEGLHDGGVAGRLECLSLGRQAPPQVAEIIDLAIEDHDVPRHRVHHGLDAVRRQIEDCEPPVGQQRPPTAIIGRGDPGAAGVRTAVDHGVAHALQSGAIGRVQSAYDPGNATHRRASSKKRDVGLGPTAPYPSPYGASWRSRRGAVWSSGATNREISGAHDLNTSCCFPGDRQAMGRRGKNRAGAPLFS
mgnify:CR=1 FL=1